MGDKNRNSSKVDINTLDINLNHYDKIRLIGDGKTIVERNTDKLIKILK